jgi:chemotaxis protein CheD
MSNANPSASEVCEVVLQPGEYFVGDRKHRVHTLLGSCVSITLWHPRARIGAMSHYMLAQRGSNDKGMALNARYGEEALTLMIEQLADLGVAANKCQAKVFGGGEMFLSHQGNPSVGRKNGDAARELLRERGITLTAASMFGIGHRNIIFNVNTGDVWSRQVDPASVVLVPQQELPCPISR